MLITRMKLFWGALVRSALVAIPSVLLIPFWCNSIEGSLGPHLYFIWAVATLLITWFGALNGTERHALLHLIGSRIKLLAR
jgi:hypothetical protein